MDQYASQVSQALKGAYSGDSNQLSILEQMKANFQEYCTTLLFIIKTDPSISKNALIELTRTIETNIHNFSPEFIQFLCSEFMELYYNLSDSDHLRLLASTFIKLYEIIGSNWAKFPSVFEPNPPKMPFQIELMLHLFRSFTKFGGMIIENAGNFADFLLFGLREGSWDMKVKCIQMISQLAAIDSTLLAPHIEIILAMIHQSNQLEELNFMSLWTEFSAFIELSSLSPEQNQIAFQAAFESLQSPHLSLESRSLALTTINSLPFPDQETAILVLNNAFTISVLKGENGEFLESIGDLFGRSIDTFGSQPIYDFLKQKIMESINPPNLIAIAVSLYIISEVIEKLKSQIRDDWAVFHQMVENAAKSENEFLIESCLIFISQLNSDFERQILESNLFVDFIIPLIPHPKPAIHFQALEAMYQMLDSISLPVQGVSEKLWAIQPCITSNENQYLTLFAKAIEQEGKYFVTEHASQISEILLQFFQSDNDDIVIGALSVATTLLLTNEEVHPLILEATIHTIEACILSDNSDRQNNGLLRMNSLFPTFKDRFSQDTVQKIMELLNHRNHSIVEAASKCIALIAKELNQNELTEKLLSVFQHWIENSENDYYNVALTSIISLSPIVNDEYLVGIVNTICQITIQSRNEEKISDSIDAIAALISKNGGKHCLPQIVELATGLALNFIQGKFSICENKLPLECEISVIKSITGLICELVQFPSEANRQFFAFTQLYLKEGDEFIDLAMNILGAGILFDGFNASEKSFVFGEIMSISKPDTNIDLIQNITYIMMGLVEKDIMTADNIQPVIPIINQWWNDLYATSRNTMISTLTNLAILFWEIALKCGTNFIVPEIFALSFEMFPSDDQSDMIRMPAMLIQMVQIQFPFPVQIALAICRLLVLPQMMISRIGVSDEIIVNLGQVLNGLYHGNSEVQAAVCELIQNSQIWRNRIGQYL